MASCKNDFICTLLMQFFYSFLSVQLIWKNFAPGRSPPTSKFMRDCLCLACVQTYPISSVATKVIGDICMQASRRPTPAAALNRTGGHEIRSTSSPGLFTHFLREKPWGRGWRSGATRSLRLDYKVVCWEGATAQRL